ncbi:MAG TPA: aminotransferase class I/II-fold pyridoxal phosphate-dependent enzyme, partial [Gemmatimonadales bacterium]|nr:aminotransferase class I/II-fold pyridoxal phosphate-dependent enzyme [Gemmatimonadales bacterium]
DLIGRRVHGVELTTNEAIRKLLLEEAGIAMVPFDAFGLTEQTGWFRLSAGAVSVQEIVEGLDRVRTLLESL